jgi:hypothetical protein
LQEFGRKKSTYADEKEFPLLGCERGLKQRGNDSGEVVAVRGKTSDVLIPAATIRIKLSFAAPDLRTFETSEKSLRKFFAVELVSG